jgi:hypothetical protein
MLFLRADVVAGFGFALGSPWGWFQAPWVMMVTVSFFLDADLDAG